MNKHKGYFYTVKHVETARNSSAPLKKKYAWFIRNGKGVVLESSLDRDEKEFETMWYDKGEAAYDCREAISDYHR